MNDFLNWGLPILAVAVGIALSIWDDYQHGNAPAETAPTCRVIVQVDPTTRPTPTRGTAATWVSRDSGGPRLRLDEDWAQLMATHPELRSLNHPDPGSGDLDT